MKMLIKKEKNKSSVKAKFARNIPGWGLLIPSIFLFFFLVWRPIAIGIGYSFFDLTGFTPTEFVGLKNYSDVLSDTNFIQTLFNTLKYVFWSIIIGFPLPFISAFFLNEMIHAKTYFKISLYLPVIIPGIATCMIWRMVFMGGEGGLLNMIGYFFGAAPMDWLGNKSLVIPLIIASMTWNGFGSTMIIYLATLQGVNQELYEAARIDGAGAWNRFKVVVWPHMRSVIFLLLIKQMIGLFNITEQPLTMTGGGPNGASMSLGLTNYFYAFKYGQFEKSLSLGVIMFCFLFVLTIVYFWTDKRLEE